MFEIVIMVEKKLVWLILGCADLKNRRVSVTPDSTEKNIKANILNKQTPWATAHGVI
jgi:ABC-type amino acid transport substrate-binding protein